MKIAFYNHTGQVSGGERVLLTMVSRLQSGEFDASLICPGEGTLAHDAAAADITVKTVPNLKARFTWRPDRFVAYCHSFYKVIAAVRSRFLEIDPDLIHANSIRAGLVATAATIGLRKPVIWHLHDLLPRHPLSSAIRTVVALSRRTRMIAVSQAVADNFAGRLSRLLQPRVTVILNAVDLKLFSSCENDKERCRAQLNITRNEVAVGIIGQITPRKAQYELLLAFEQVLKRVPQAVLVIVGAPLFNKDSEYEQLLRDTSQRLGISNRVMMLGARKDVPEILRALDLMVINSRKEPFGLVACEAMAAGTAVIATDIDGLSEIFSHQRNGWLVPCGDQQALSEAIAFLSEQPDVREELATVALADVKQRFTIERFMNELRAVYRTCVDQSKAIKTRSNRSEEVTETSFAR
jgi:glycosyltransferase involved in cell wall biosynthesis